MDRLYDAEITGFLLSCLLVEQSDKSRNCVRLSAGSLHRCIAFESPLVVKLFESYLNFYKFACMVL